MPLILLSGYPCSGLSHRASQLLTQLQEIQSSLPTPPKPPYKFHIVSSHDESHPRTVYDAARSEKEARAVVYGRVKRLLGKDSVVIVDGMNYIKGWRYQLYCEAKAVATTSCVVHVGTPIDQCVANNDARLRRKEKKQKAKETQSTTEEAAANSTEEKQKGAADVEQPASTEDEDTEEPYPPELLNNLIFRYEEPSTASRWDKPLFTVPWSDPSPPAEAIWTAITGIPIPTSTPEGGPSGLTSTSTPTLSDTASIATSATRTTTTPVGAGIQTNPLRTRPKIIPHQATQAPATTSPSALYNIEKLTSEIISTLRTFTLEHPTAAAAAAASSSDSSPAGLTIPIPSTKTPVFIPSSALEATATDELAGAGGILALPRLQRLRRQWVGMNRAYVGKGGAMEGEQAGEAFVRFLNAEFEGTGVEG